MLKGISGRSGKTDTWRVSKIHNEELRNLYYLQILVALSNLKD
jgi:hypothetical protein